MLKTNVTNLQCSPVMYRISRPIRARKLQVGIQRRHNVRSRFSSNFDEMDSVSFYLLITCSTMTPTLTNIHYTVYWCSDYLITSQDEVTNWWEKKHSIDTTLTFFQTQRFYYNMFNPVHNPLKYWRLFGWLSQRKLGSNVFAHASIIQAVTFDMSI